ncbi:MAG TPA: VWA domain-containing protein, partial [bacterium]|nr:VWA domain-containing protein [bacterium]
RSSLPGTYAQVTPTPIQRVRGNPLDPAHKNFWWHNKLAREYPPGGGTAIGPAMQFSRDMIEGMPLHVPIYTPGNPTPSTPKPTVEGNDFMIVLTDGQPNDYWTPAPSEIPPWSNNAYSHCIEIARRSTLGSPFGAYNDVWDITIFTIGLGSQVDTNLLALLADPWNWAFMNGTPTPTDANHGFFTWALTEDDLIDAFEAIAGTIVSNLAGSDIYVLEVVPATNLQCPDGATVLTEIDPSTINPPPTILPPSTPGNSPEYTWNFQELFIGDELEITFRMNIPTAAPTGVFSLIECPASNITYLDYQGIPAETPIYDPGFMMGICDGPTHTPTPTPTVTPTPTCVPGPLFYDDFETGDFSLWDSAQPAWGVHVFNDSNYSYAGDYFAYFAGSELPSVFGYNEGSTIKIIDFSDPIRPGAVLEFYVRVKGFSFPQKSNKSGLDDPDQYDIFLAEVSDFYGNFVYQALDYSDMTDDYIQVRLPLTVFAGSDAVRIRLLSYYPVTVHDPDPSSNEPMAFVDEVLVWDFCYAATPTPTPTQPQGPIIPATSPRGIGIILLIVSILLVVPLIRRAG